MPTIIPNLWYDTEAEEAATFYVAVFNDAPARSEDHGGGDRGVDRRTPSRIVAVNRFPDGAPGPAGAIMSVEFELDGQRFVGVNGRPQLTFNETMSLQIVCGTQDEIDHFWIRLTDDGHESQCGWLTDRYGLSWQVVPEDMSAVLADLDPQRAQRAVQAMLTMTKLDLDALRRAADAVPSG